VTPGGDVAARSVDGALYVISPDGTANLIASELEAAGWSPNGRMLFVQSDAHSLQVYNVRDERWSLSREELHLVQRLSRPITSVQWFAGGRHLLYQVNDEIVISEIDTRDHPITYQVDSVNLGDAQAAVGEDGEVLFFLKNQHGSRDLIAAELIITNQ
jgi:WD40 repeat protein